MQRIGRHMSLTTRPNIPSVIFVIVEQAYLFRWTFPLVSMLNKPSEQIQRVVKLGPTHIFHRKAHSNATQNTGINMELITTFQHPIGLLTILWGALVAHPSHSVASPHRHHNRLRSRIHGMHATHKHAPAPSISISPPAQINCGTYTRSPSQNTQCCQIIYPQTI